MDNRFLMNAAIDARDLLRVGDLKSALQQLDWAIEKELATRRISASQLRQVAK